jgi:glycerol uptake facilitator-like aquaporin
MTYELCAGKIPNYALIAEFTGTLLFQFMGGAAAVNAASTGRRRY